MSGIGLFLTVGAIIIVIGAMASYKTRTAMQEFWDSRVGKNVPGGIYTVFAVMVLFSLAAIFFSSRASADSKYVEMYTGLESTFKKSAFCKPEQYNDRLTSNVGFRLGFSGDSLSPYLKYQHHSCAYNQDEPTYDAFGLGADLKLYGVDRRWLSTAGIFAGVDYSDDNVVCVGREQYSTNAGGFVGLYRSSDRLFMANLKAQYHNCLRGSGIRYFGGGIELVLRVGS